jgi:hypothetical protein
MGRLTTEEMLFLHRHKVPMSMVFDATGIADWQSEIDEDKYFAFGTTPCKREGHTLRSRSNNCIQCKTANIAFQLRNTKPAEVYVAASRSKQLFKVGSTTELNRRIEMLSRVAYGGATDWFVIANVRCKKAGAVEFQIHKKLESFQYEVAYVDAGREIQAYELFSCDYQSVRITFIASVPEDERGQIQHHANAKSLCAFPPRPRKSA